MLVVREIALKILFSFVIGVLVGPIVIKLMKKLNILQPGKDELERVIKTAALTRGRPIMGGMIILIPLFFMSLANASTYSLLLVVLLIPAVMVGVVNDILDLRGKLQRMRIHDRVNMIIHGSWRRWIFYYYLTWPYQKFKEITTPLGSYTSGLRVPTRLLLQIFLGVWGIYWLNQFNLLPHSLFVPFVGDLHLPVVLVWGFYVFVVVAFINAFNITDGLDGISAVTHLISWGVMLMLFAESALNRQVLPLLIGAELAFLVFNIPPAKIEMSDTGTVPLGYLFALLSISAGKVLATPFIGAWFVIVVSSSFLQVWGVRFLKRRIFKIAPVHHLLELYGIERCSIVFYAGVINAIGGVIAMILFG